jgi:hypothetical protein
MVLSNVIGTKSEGGEMLQIFYEVQLLRAFLRACDVSGISVPGDSPQVRTEISAPTWEIFDIKKGETWPPSLIYPVLAAAQHHGVPTCLLDWSKRSFVAAYFAASAALQDLPSSKELAVWVLDISQWWSWYGDTGISFLEMPGATSTNLAAQSGVFTVSTRKIHTRDELEPTSLEKLLEEPESESEKPLISKLTLPLHEAPNVLSFCAEFGIMGSTMFPGYEGVAREIRDNAFAGTLEKSLWLYN